VVGRFAAALDRDHRHRRAARVSLRRFAPERDDRIVLGQQELVVDAALDAREQELFLQLVRRLVLRATEPPDLEPRAHFF
jgi:hypothetical protein